MLIFTKYSSVEEYSRTELALTNNIYLYIFAFVLVIYIVYC